MYFNKIMSILIFFFQTCKAVYDKIIDLKIATPQIIINYGLFLEENNYFEEAFRVNIIIVNKSFLFAHLHTLFI